MAKIDINRITNAGVYIDGDSYLGQVEEITLPGIKPVMSEHKALGLNSKIELPSGMEKLEGKIKFNSLYPNIIKIFADFYKHHDIQVRFQAQVYGSNGSSSVSGQCFLRIQSKGVPGASFKPQDNVESESDFQALYMKMIVDGQVLYEVDVFNNTYKVGGVDVLKDFKTSLG